MRTILAVLVLALLAAPAMAFDYANARFGYAITIPDGYVGQGEAANGDGQEFRSRDGRRTIAVYGGNMLHEDMESAAGHAAEYHDGEGWDIGYQRTTPGWASFSGSRNGQILYVRMIALCAGTQFAAFEARYGEADLRAMNSVIDGLVRSLRGAGRGAGC